MARDNDIHIDTFIPYMRDVARCERSLHELNLLWRLIESSAKMNCAEEVPAGFVIASGDAAVLLEPGACACRSRADRLA